MILSEEKRDVLKKDADDMLEEVEILMNKSQLEECIQKLQVVMNDYEILGEYSLYLKCHLYSAVCYYNLGNLKLAFELTNIYEDLCNQYKVPIDKVEYYALLALQYMYKDDMNKAIVFFDDASKYALKAKLYHRFVAFKKHVAHAAIKLKKFDVSIEALQEAKKYLYLLNPNDVNLVEVYLVEINVYLEQNNFELAKQLLDFAKKHPVLEMDEVTNSIYYEYLSNYYVKLENYEQAYNSAIQALSLLNGKNQHVTEHELYESLIKICEKLNNSQLLIDVYAKYVESLKDSQQKNFRSELLKRDFEDMKKLTETDNLTGVYNRKYLIENASEWLNLNPMNSSSIFCSVFDVDHFKQINDTYGHLIGDELLKALANECNTKMIKDEMFLARYGGDEFVIIYRTPSIEDGLHQINRIYNELNDFEFEIKDQRFTLSISMGISYTKIGEYKMFEELFKEADVALYRSKENGRKLFSLYN